MAKTKRKKAKATKAPKPIPVTEEVLPPPMEVDRWQRRCHAPAMFDPKIVPELRFSGDPENPNDIIRWGNALRTAWWDRSGSWITTAGLNIVRLHCEAAAALRDKNMADYFGHDPVEDWRAIAAARNSSTSKREVVENEAGVHAESSTGRKGGHQYRLFDHPVTAVLRWMGANAWTKQDARTALDKLGFRSVADGTIQAQLAAGRNGSRGEPANLTADQEAELDRLVNPEPEPEPEPEAKPKKKRKKK